MLYRQYTFQERTHCVPWSCSSPSTPPIPPDAGPEASFQGAKEGSVEATWTRCDVCGAAEGRYLVTDNCTVFPSSVLFCLGPFHFLFIFFSLSLLEFFQTSKISMCACTMLLLSTLLEFIFFVDYFSDTMSVCYQEKLAREIKK